MSNLKDLPTNTIWPHVQESIDRNLMNELVDYANYRKSEVERGAETSALAALLVEKYASGLAKAIEIIGIESSLPAEIDRIVMSINPNFKLSSLQRWVLRPATLTDKSYCSCLNHDLTDRT